MNKSITIIIPAYNEEKRIIKTLYEIDNYISSLQANLIQVLVINDGSTDRTQSIVESWIKESSVNKKSFTILNYSPNKGKGYAVRHGILNSNTELVLYTDADGASPIKELEKLLPWINESFDVVVGSRVLKDDTNVIMSCKRRFIGLMFHLILRFLMLANIKDTQCGFKLFKTNIAKNIAQLQQCFNYSFDIEYLLLAKKLGCKVKEVPINWYHVEGSKVSIVRDSIKMFLEVLKIRFVYRYNI